MPLVCYNYSLYLISAWKTYSIFDNEPKILTGYVVEDAEALLIQRIYRINHLRLSNHPYRGGSRDSMSLFELQKLLLTKAICPN